MILCNLATVCAEAKSVAKSRLHCTFDLIGQREKKLQSSQFIELVLRPVFAVLKYLVDNGVLKMYLLKFETYFLKRKEITCVTTNYYLNFPGN